jgi:hypothetical protein
MSSDFKDLNIDRTRLKESVEKFWKMNNCQKCSYSSEKPLLHQVKYTQDNLDVMVSLHHNKSGTMTINTKVGRSQEKGEELAVYLKDELVSDSRKSIFVKIEGMNKDSFQLLLDYLQENKDEALITVSPSSEDQVKKIVRITSQYNDSLTLTHFLTTNNLSIQGKPLYIYNQVCYLLSELIGLDGFFNIFYKGEEKSRSIKIDQNVVDSDLRKLLPTAYLKLGDGILTMIKTSYILKDILIPLEDYSYCVFPSLRALEAVMRRLLFNEASYSIEHDNNNSFGGIFYKDSARRIYLVNDEFREKINNGALCESLEECYTYFKQQRDELFHANDFTDSTRFIPTQDQAEKIVGKVIKMIELAYSKI